MKKKILLHSNCDIKNDIKKQLQIFKEHITIKTTFDDSSKFDIIYLVLCNFIDIKKMVKLLNNNGIILVSIPLPQINPTLNIEIIKKLNNVCKKLLLIDMIDTTYIYGKKTKGGTLPYFTGLHNGTRYLHGYSYNEPFGRGYIDGHDNGLRYSYPPYPSYPSYQLSPKLPQLQQQPQQQMQKPQEPPQELKLTDSDNAIFSDIDIEEKKTLSRHSDVVDRLKNDKLFNFASTTLCDIIYHKESQNKDLNNRFILLPKYGRKIIIKKENDYVIKNILTPLNESFVNESKYINYIYTKICDNKITLRYESKGSIKELLDKHKNDSKAIESILFQCIFSILLFYDVSKCYHNNINFDNLQYIDIDKESYLHYEKFFRNVPWRFWIRTYGYLIILDNFDKATPINDDKFREEKVKDISDYNKYLYDLQKLIDIFSDYIHHNNKEKWQKIKYSEKFKGYILMHENGKSETDFDKYIVNFILLINEYYNKTYRYNYIKEITYYSVRDIFKEFFISKDSVSNEFNKEKEEDAKRKEEAKKEEARRLLSA
jgi:hypothetical protein